MNGRGYSLGLLWVRMNENTADRFYSCAPFIFWKSSQMVVRFGF
jgi:hypothetical protein